MWAGTLGGGLAHLDNDGHWQTYSKDSTRGGLPSDYVQALALGADGSLWVGTTGGLARLDKNGHWGAAVNDDIGGAAQKIGLRSRLR